MTCIHDRAAIQRGAFAPSRPAARASRRAVPLVLLGVAPAVLAGVALHLAGAWPTAVGQVIAPVPPTPAPDPSIGTALLQVQLWMLGGLVLATVLAFAVIARLSRHTAGDD